MPAAPEGPVRVVLVDDHAMVREALARTLDASDRIRVVGQADEGAAALERVAETEPDVVLLDYTMPGMPAASVIDQLQRSHPRVRVIVLTVHESIHYAIRVLEAGAHGFVVKAAGLDELTEAIDAVLGGEVFVSPKVSQRVLQHLRQPGRERSGLSALSQREFDLLRLLGAGLGLQECAAHLGISPSTCSTYRARLMTKLGLRSTGELIRFALENEVVG